MVCVQRRVSRELLPLRFCSHVIYYLIEFVTVVFYVSQLLCLAFAKVSNKERFKSPSDKSAKMSWTCFFNAEGEAPALCARSGGDHTASHCKHRPSKTSWRHTAVAGMCVCVCEGYHGSVLDCWAHTAGMQQSTIRVKTQSHTQNRLLIEIYFHALISEREFSLQSNTHVFLVVLKVSER